MFTQLLMLLIIIAVFSVLWWGLTQLTLPQPMKVILTVLLALIGLAMIWNFVVSGHVPRLTGA